MKMIVDPRKLRYVSGVGILLVMMTFTMTVMGCDSGGAESHTLTVNSTAGGAVTSPGEGTFSYDEGTVINLVATADEGYQFQGWNGDTEGVANIASRITSIVLNQDSSITANFGPAGSHGPVTP